ncbi:uncharacterized protein LOC141594243 [Silene latifolia]|uniref:uncharacterized protein LOC141594243 n=1 Tax=Silene latifolia TaxID=37657 RepID=UPI003D77C84F
MSTISSLVISILCMIFLRISVVDGRHIGVVKDDERPIFIAQDATKDIATPKMEQTTNTPSRMTITSSNNVHDKTKVEEVRNKKKMSKLTQVQYQHEERMIPNNSKHIKGNKFRKVEVTWRVPRNKNGVPYTGY